MADHLAVLNMPMDALKRSHTVTSFEPFTLLSALAMVTERLGLAATGSTTFDEPYHVARRFASLDHLSGGRAAWNIVTTSNPDAAKNFGLEDHVEHGERYRRAREFYDVVTGLWDSWADDAFIRDVENGIYFDPGKLHVLDHKGEHLSVRGPLNIARPIAGLAGDRAGRRVRCRPPARGRNRGSRVHRAEQHRRRAEILRRREGPDAEGRPRARRHEDHAGLFCGGRRHASRRRARSARISTVSCDYANAIASLSIALGHDASKFDPDGPLPDIPESNASKSGARRRGQSGEAREPDRAAAGAAARRL